MNSQITDRTFGGKCGCRAEAAPWAWLVSCSIDARASEPRPMPDCCRNRRREGRCMLDTPMPLIHENELVQTEQHLARIGPSRAPGAPCRNLQSAVTGTLPCCRSIGVGCRLKATR